jgi:uncharacterized protein
MSDETTNGNLRLLTPCVGICRIIPENGLCSGCWRTINEITAWSTMDDAERLRIVSNLVNRAALLR